MLALAHGFAIQHGIAEHVQVELDVRGGLPGFSVIGLAAGSARDARERVQAAVVNSGLTFPRQRVTVNLAPASQRRAGAQFDLAIACSVLAAQGELNAARLTQVGLYAELGLGGQLRPCPFVAVAAEAAAEAGLRGLIVAREDLAEAREFARVQVLGRDALRDVVALLAGPGPDEVADRRNGNAGSRRNGAGAARRVAGTGSPAAGGNIRSEHGEAPLRWESCGAVSGRSAAAGSSASGDAAAGPGVGASRFGSRGGALRWAADGPAERRAKPLDADLGRRPDAVAQPFRGRPP